MFLVVSYSGHRDHGVQLQVIDVPPVLRIMLRKESKCHCCPLLFKFTVIPTGRSSVNAKLLRGIPILSKSMFQDRTLWQGGALSRPRTNFAPPQCPEDKSSSKFRKPRIKSRSSANLASVSVMLAVDLDSVRSPGPYNRTAEPPHLAPLVVASTMKTGGLLYPTACLWETNDDLSSICQTLFQSPLSGVGPTSKSKSVCLLPEPNCKLISASLRWPTISFWSYPNSISFVDGSFGKLTCDVSCLLN